MSTYAKVAWSEGVLLSHQHFQQLERYIESQRQSQIQNLCNYYWGITALEIDQSQFKLGKFALAQVQAIFSDGTVLNAPDVDQLPALLDVPAGTAQCDICLAISAKQVGLAEMDALSPDKANQLRYKLHEVEIDDVARIPEQKITMGVAQLQSRLVLASEAQADQLLVPVARVLSCDAERGLLLDTDFIATGVNVQHLPVLQSLANEYHALLYHRKQKLAEHVQVHKGKLFSDLSDLLLLQLCNRETAQLQRQLQQPVLHPHRLYQRMLGALAELSTFVTSAKTYDELPAYQHDNLTASFTPLMQELRHALSTVLEQPSIEIPISQNNNGHYIAVIEDKKLFDNGEFILGVKADLGAEHLEKRVRSQSKIGPIDMINELISSQVPGIQLTALPVALPQIPYVAGMHYFMLDVNSQYWHKAKTSGGVAMQFIGELPGLEVALWAIKQ